MVEILSYNKSDKTKYEKHLSVDIETLGQSKNSAILSIGAVVFDPYDNDLEALLSDPGAKHSFTTLYEKVDIDSCVNLDMVIEDDTMLWWSKQKPEIIEAAFSDAYRKPIADVLKELFIFSKHCTKFWCKSPEFDAMILEYAAKKSNLGTPWSYHQLRDIRTLEELTGLNTKSSNSHDALGDAYNQAMTVQQGYKKLNLVRPEWPE